MEPRKLSFRALDIEQIGHVYEGLLDHTAVRAEEPILGLVGTKDKEPEISLAALEAQAAKGETVLVAFLKEQTGKSLSALQKAVASQASQPSGAGETPQDHRARQRLLIACNNDRALFDRILPFAKLIRLDTLDYPVVIPAGSVYVTAGVDRRQTGTHYTPRNLTEEIVQYTLEPLVYEGVAEGKPKEAWRLRSPAELLQLKICDMAMGSGAFLVQICRYLAGKLVEAWQQMEAEHPGQVVIAPEGTLSAALPEECPIPKDADERLVVARRIVADRCLYGVDKNPLAVEMAKLSLWLITLAKGRPFTFVDHALKWGDSLLGITRPEQIEFLKLNPEKEAVQLRTVSDRWKPFVQRAIAKRQELENFSVSDIADIQKKEQLNREAEEAIAYVRHVGDFLVAEALAQAGKTSDLTDEEIQVLAEVVIEALDEADAEKRNQEIAAILAKTERMMNLGNPANQPPRKPFHWLLEFPEVFLQEDAPKGFAAIVGNPPFLGGRYLSGQLGGDCLSYLKSNIAFGKKGNSDIVSYFYLRSNSLIQENGTSGFIGTKTAIEGDTHDIGLAQLTKNGSELYSAFTSKKWSGDAAVLYIEIFWSNGRWQGNRFLDGLEVSHISSQLTDGNYRKPNQLFQKINPYQGSYVHGMGFFLTSEQRYSIIQKDENSNSCIFPCITANDFNNSPTLESDRFVIYFEEMLLEEASQYSGAWQHLLENVKDERQRVGNQKYKLADYWWRFKHPTKPLYEAIWKQSKTLVCPVVSKYLSFAWLDKKTILLNKMFAFINANNESFTVLQSSIYDFWARYWSGSLGETLQFAPTDCFNNFPFPTTDPSDLSTQFPTLNTIGETYYTHRQAIMCDRQEGLTKTYNRFHDANEKASDIQKLRSLILKWIKQLLPTIGRIST